MAILAVGLVLAGVTVTGGVVLLVFGSLLGRGAPDDSGQRAEAAYLAVIGFVSIYLTLFASFGLVASVASLLSPQASPIPRTAILHGSAVYGASRSQVSAIPVIRGAGTPPPNPPFIFNSPTGGGPSHDDNVVSGSLATGLVGLAALGVLGYHRRRLSAMLADTGPGPATRVMTVYRLAVSFVAVFIVAFAGAAALYGFYRLVAPGISGSSGRAGGAEELIDAAYLAFGAGVVFVWHRRRTGPPRVDAAESAPLT